MSTAFCLLVLLVSSAWSNLIAAPLSWKESPEGALDVVDDKVLAGWVCHRPTKLPTQLRLRVDGVLEEQAAARYFNRADLAPHLLPLRNRHGFAFSLPEGLATTWHSFIVEARIPETEDWVPLAHRCCRLGSAFSPRGGLRRLAQLSSPLGPMSACFRIWAHDPSSRREKLSVTIYQGQTLLCTFELPNYCVLSRGSSPLVPVAVSIPLVEEAGPFRLVVRDQTVAVVQ